MILFLVGVCVGGLAGMLIGIGLIVIAITQKGEDKSNE